MMKNFLEIGGWSKKYIHTSLPKIFLKVMEQCSKTTINHGNWGGVVKANYSYHPPQNILEGNGVVFENFTINHGNVGGGWSKQIIHTCSPNILEGNGVVFENFTINHGNGGGGDGQNKLFIPAPQIFLKVMG